MFGERDRYNVKSFRMALSLHCFPQPSPVEPNLAPKLPMVS